MACALRGRMVMCKRVQQLQEEKLFVGEATARTVCIDEALRSVQVLERRLQRRQARSAQFIAREDLFAGNRGEQIVQALLDDVTENALRETFRRGVDRQDH